MWEIFLSKRFAVIIYSGKKKVANTNYLIVNTGFGALVYLFDCVIYSLKIEKNNL